MIAEMIWYEESLQTLTSLKRNYLLCLQTDIILRRHLAEAIAMCSKWGNNAKRFSQEGAVERMVEYLGSHDIIVQRSAMRALEQLGKHPDSCITMHRSGVVKVTQRC